MTMAMAMGGLGKKGRHLKLGRQKDPATIQSSTTPSMDCCTARQTQLKKLVFTIFSPRGFSFGRKQIKRKCISSAASPAISIQQNTDLTPLFHKGRLNIRADPPSHFLGYENIIIWTLPPTFCDVACLNFLTLPPPPLHLDPPS